MPVGAGRRGERESGSRPAQGRLSWLPVEGLLRALTKGGKGTEGAKGTRGTRVLRDVTVLTKGGVGNEGGKSDNGNGTAKSNEGNTVAY